MSRYRDTRVKAYFTFNNWLPEVIEVLIKHIMFNVGDISALKFTWIADIYTTSKEVLQVIMIYFLGDTILQ